MMIIVTMENYRSCGDGSKKFDMPDDKANSGRKSGKVEFASVTNVVKGRRIVVFMGQGQE